MSISVAVDWIGDSMPDVDTVVLVYDPQSDEPVWLGYHDGERWRTVEGLWANTPTHWAHLPDPPQ